MVLYKNGLWETKEVQKKSEVIKKGTSRIRVRLPIDPSCQICLEWLAKDRAIGFLFSVANQKLYIVRFKDKEEKAEIETRENVTTYFVSNKRLFWAESGALHRESCKDPSLEFQLLTSKNKELNIYCICPVRTKYGDRFLLVSLQSKLRPQVWPWPLPIDTEPPQYT